jgi:hypothetical protein
MADEVKLVRFFSWLVISFFSIVRPLLLFFSLQLSSTLPPPHIMTCVATSWLRPPQLLVVLYIWAPGWGAIDASALQQAPPLHASFCTGREHTRREGRQGRQAGKAGKAGKAGRKAWKGVGPNPEQIGLNRPMGWTGRGNVPAGIDFAAASTSTSRLSGPHRQLPSRKYEKYLRDKSLPRCAARRSWFLVFPRIISRICHTAASFRLWGPSPTHASPRPAHPPPPVSPRSEYPRWWLATSRDETVRAVLSLSAHTLLFDVMPQFLKSTRMDEECQTYSTVDYAPETIAGRNALKGGSETSTRT